MSHKLQCFVDTNRITLSLLCDRFGLEVAIDHAGGEVYKLAVEIMVKSVKKVLNQEGLDENDIDILIPHQANMRILKKVAMKLNLPIDNVMMNIDKYGNTSAASIPIALSESVMEKKIKKGDIVVLVAFGAGLTWGASVIRW